MAISVPIPMIIVMPMIAVMSSSILASQSPANTAVVERTEAVSAITGIRNRS